MADQVVTKVKNISKQVRSNPRLFKLFNKDKLYNLRLGKIKKVYYSINLYNI